MGDAPNGIDASVLPPFPILYEDNHLLVIVKPAGMPVQRDDSGDRDVLTAAKDYIGARYRKPGAVYIGLVHRLDRPVGGVLALARTSKAASRLSEAMRAHAIEKEYLCVARGDPGAGVAEHWLLKDAQANTVRVVAEGTQGAKFARLSYRTVERRDGLSLVRVTLDTGRSHQIRVQMAAIGCPLVGDVKYGGDAPGQLVALWSCRLALDHPTRKERMAFEAMPPKEGVWARFEGAFR